MRSTALMMPTLIDGGWSTSGSSVRPRAIAHWPISHVLLRERRRAPAGPFASIFSSVSIRVWSVATTLATSRSGWPGTVTKMSRRLVGEVEGAGDDVAVGGDDEAGGRADALADAGRRRRARRAAADRSRCRRWSRSARRSARPWPTAAFMAFSVASLTSSAARPAAREEQPRRRRPGAAVRRSMRVIAGSGRPCRGRFELALPQGRDRVTASWASAAGVGGASASPAARRASVRSSAASRRGGLPARTVVPGPRVFFMHVVERLDADDRLAVDVDDQVVRLQPGLRRRASRARTSSTYGGVRSTTFGTRTMPW